MLKFGNKCNKIISYMGSDFLPSYILLEAQKSFLWYRTSKTKKITEITVSLTLVQNSGSWWRFQVNIRTYILPHLNSLSSYLTSKSWEIQSKSANVIDQILAAFSVVPKESRGYITDQVYPKKSHVFTRPEFTLKRLQKLLIPQEAPQINSFSEGSSLNGLLL